MDKKTVTITGKKTAATVFVSDLIVKIRQVIYLTAYGPSQEMRAFAQLLCTGEANLELEGEMIRRAELNGTLRLIPNLGNGYTGLYVVPERFHYIIGANEEECFNTFSRILDQKFFVHRDWYKNAFELANELVPKIGTKKCYLMPADMNHETQQRLKYGGWKFPEATATLHVVCQEPKPTEAD